MDSENSQPSLSKDINALSDIHQSASRMVAYEGRTIWHATAVYVQFSFLLIAGSVFPFFIGSDDPKFISIGGLLASLIGLFLTILWLALASRAKKYQLYWILSTRELERSLPEEMRMFIRGERFAEGDTVEVDREHIRFTSFERIRTNRAIPILYVTFIVAFSSLVILNFIRVVSAY